MDNIRVYSAAVVRAADQNDAVLMAVLGDERATSVVFTIDDARELSNELARAADDAERKLEEAKTKTLDL